MHALVLSALLAPASAADAMFSVGHRTEAGQHEVVAGADVSLVRGDHGAFASEWLLVDGTVAFDVGTRRGRVADLHVVPVRGEIFGFWFEPGGFDLRTDPVVQGETLALNIGSLGYRADHRLTRAAPLALRLDAGLTASIAQRNRTGLAFAAHATAPIRWCSSGSILYAAMGLVYGPIHAVALGGVEGDPIHFVDGSACFGGPPLWRTSEWVGGRTGLTLLGRVDLQVEVRHTARHVHLDTAHGDPDPDPGEAHRHHDGSSVLIHDAAGTAVTSTVAIAF